MSMRRTLDENLTKEELMCKFYFADSGEREHAERYLELKGIMNHINIINFLINDGVELTLPDDKIQYSIVKNFYRYDKRLRKIIYKYVAALEEYLRAKICLTTISVDKQWFSQKRTEKSKDRRNIANKLNRAEKLSEISLGRIVHLVEKLINSGNENFLNYEIEKLRDIVGLRNMISHFSMISIGDKLSNNCSSEEDHSALQKSLINLMNYLPEYYKNYFIEEINSASDIISGIRGLHKYVILFNNL